MNLHTRKPGESLADRQKIMKKVGKEKQLQRVDHWMNPMMKNQHWLK